MIIDLMNFMIVFGIYVLAFVSIFYLIFFPYWEQYSTFGNSIR